MVLTVDLAESSAPVRPSRRRMGFGTDRTPVPTIAGDAPASASALERCSKMRASWRRRWMRNARSATLR